jgi:uncharacterized OB-fold protein
MKVSAFPADMRFKKEGEMEASADTFLTPAVPLDFVYNYRIGSYMERYLEGFKERKILGSRCPDCGKVVVPARMYCGVCNSRMDELVEVAQEGTMENLTIGHVALEKGALKPAENPYLLGMIRLDGVNSLLLAMVEGIPVEEARAGMRVKAVWKDEVAGDYGDLDHFEPV